MSSNSHIIDAAELRRLSGLQQPAAVKRWASTQGIRVRDGAEGPWTTVEAINAALGVGSAGNDDAYRPEDLL
ncbi:hypothetical protein ACQKIE_16275 [Luteibacter sp. NPDC031894]|uniref:hypothetical protein n=1 Tax=Luteibacter sp. NPDC031894 TaxID=3390572 RepID=UPI003CFF8943